MDQKPSIPPRPVSRRPISRLASLGVPGKHVANATLASRRVSVPGLTSEKKAQRTSKTTQKLVVLPSAPQTKPLVAEEENDLTLGHEIDGGIREYKSAPERMTKDQRKLAGYKRITAYCIAESFKMKLLSTFLKREHNVSPRIFDEALYAVGALLFVTEKPDNSTHQMYCLPLLPGYGPNANVRSSAPPKRKKGDSILAHLSEAEEIGYEGAYFTDEQLHSPGPQYGFISPTESRKSALPNNSALHIIPLEGDPDRVIETDRETDPGFMTDPEAFLFGSKNTDLNLSRSTDGRQDIIDNNSVLDAGVETDPGIYGRTWKLKEREESNVMEEASKGKEKAKEEDVAEVVFFEYGVVVFFGLQEREEMDILDDIKTAGIVTRMLTAEDWEIEECHYTVSYLLQSLLLSNGLLGVSTIPILRIPEFITISLVSVSILYVYMS